MIQDLFKLIKIAMKSRNKIPSLGALSFAVGFTLVMSGLGAESFGKTGLAVTIAIFSGAVFLSIGSVLFTAGMITHFMAKFTKLEAEISVQNQKLGSQQQELKLQAAGLQRHRDVLRKAADRMASFAVAREIRRLVKRNDAQAMCEILDMLTLHCVWRNFDLDEDDPAKLPLDFRDVETPSHFWVKYYEIRRKSGKQRRIEELVPKYCSSNTPEWERRYNLKPGQGGAGQFVQSIENAPCVINETRLFGKKDLRHRLEQEKQEKLDGHGIEWQLCAAVTPVNKTPKGEYRVAEGGEAFGVLCYCTSDAAEGGTCLRSEEKAIKVMAATLGYLLAKEQAQEAGAENANGS